jgi:hypothetical protein
MFFPLTDGFLLFRGERSFLVVATVRSPFGLCIEAQDGEYVQGLSAGDLVAASAPEGGPLEPALMLIELVRTYRFPLLVLPKDHPGSRRLRLVISAGPGIELNCGIQRGTHPDQHLLCASDELSGTVLTASEGGVRVENLPSGVTVEPVAAPLFPVKPAGAC